MLVGPLVVHECIGWLVGCVLSSMFGWLLVLFLCVVWLVLVWSVVVSLLISLFCCVSWLVSCIVVDGWSGVG